MGWYSDGCALFWKRDSFDLVNTQNGDCKIGNQGYIVATLRHRMTGRAIVVAVTHLKAQRSKTNEWIRCCQVEELLVAVDVEARETATNDSVNGVPILIIGDFNADPPSQVGLKESAVERILQNPVSMSSSDVRHFRSAYDIDDPIDSLFTTCKVRGTTATKRIVDYIFYCDCGGVIKYTATLRVPPVEELEPTKLPGLRYPSDHLHIGAKFEIR